MLSRNLLCILLTTLAVSQSLAAEKPAASGKIPVIVFETPRTPQKPIDDPLSAMTVYPYQGYTTAYKPYPYQQPMIAPSQLPAPSPSRSPVATFQQFPPRLAFFKPRLPTTKLMDSADLAKKFRKFLRMVSPIFSDAPETIGSYTVDEIELHLELNAKGGFSLIGQAEVGATSGITIKLKRKAQK